MNTTSDFEKNMEVAKSYVKEASERKSDWVILPEMFSYLGPYDTFEDHVRKHHQETLALLKSWAKNYHVSLFAGSIPEPAEATLDSKKVYNTCFLFSPDGQEIGKYRKVHLFNLSDEKGNDLYREENGFHRGTTPFHTLWQEWQIGLGICYDLRFPEFFQSLKKSGPVDVLIIPSAFTKVTGAYHWEILLRAKAIEYQCYVIASNQVGNHYGTKESFGHSMIIDPWGHILKTTHIKPGLITTPISKEALHKIRKKIPSSDEKIKYPY